MDPRKILKEVMEELDLNEKIRLRRVSMKRKIASFSFKTRTLRLNKNLLDLISEEELRYIIRHELVHAKVKDANHSDEFARELQKFYTENEIKEIEENMIKKFFKVRNLLEF